MITEQHKPAYADAISKAQAKSASEDQKYWVYEIDPGNFVIGPASVGTDAQMVAEVFPGGRVIAWGLAEHR